MVACASMGIPAVALRFQNVYGPGQSLSNPYTGILSIFSTRILNNNPINIFEDGQEGRDFVYIDDVVDATILSIEKEGANGQAFNIGSGYPTSVLEVAQTLIRAYQSDTKVNISGNFRLGDIRHNYADLTKSRELLGFEPAFSFDKGITHFVNWVKKQEVQKDQYEHSIELLRQKGMFK